MKKNLTLITNILFNNYFLLFIYIVLVSFVSYHHEVWRDEADSWLVARDISISGLFQFTRNSGHPSLWYWVLIPFAKLGFPNYTLSVLHLCFAISSVYIILFHSTLKKPLRILLIFGYYFFFEYAVVSRNYAISNFFLFSIAAFYSKRFDKPIQFGSLIFLLANCNIYATIFASGLGLLFLIEILEGKKFQLKTLFGLLLIILGGVVCFFQLFPSPERQPSVAGAGAFFHNINYMALPVSLAYSFTPGIISKQAFFSFIVLPIGFITLFRVKKILIFYTWVMGGHRHAGFLLIALIFSLWLKKYYEINEKSEPIYESLFEYILSFLKDSEKILNVVITISLIISIRYSYQESLKDIRYSFSNAKEVADFMSSNNIDNENSIVSAFGADRGKTVLFYLRNIKKFYYPGFDSFGSHMLWNKAMVSGEQLGHQAAIKKTMEKFSKEDNLFFLSDKKISTETKGSELIYNTKLRNEFIKDEEFYLYRIKP